MSGDAQPSLPERAAVALALVFFALALVSIGTDRLRNGDVFWQVRTGELALTEGTFPTTDSFSYTVAGSLWNNHEWGFELLAALLVRVAGWHSLRALVFVLCAGTLALYGAVLWRRVGGALAVAATCVTLLLINHKFVPAPQTVSMALFLLAFWWLRRARPLERPLPTAALLALMLLWGNLTAEALVFLPFVVLDEGTRLWERKGTLERPAMLRRLGQLGLVLLAPLVNPPWSSSLDYLLGGSAANQGVNTEFTPIFSPAASIDGLTKAVGVAVMLLYLAFVAVQARRGLPLKRVRQLGPGLLAVVAAALMERNLWLLSLPLARMAVEAAPFFRRRWGAAVAVTLLCATLDGTWLFAMGFRPPAALRLFSMDYWSTPLDETRVPVACADYLAQQPPQRVFTVRPWASYLIWRLPEGKVFIDGRNREYPRAVFDAANAIWHGAPEAPALLDSSHTQAIVASWPWAGAAALQGTAWRVSFTAPHCSVWQRAAP